MKTISSIKSKSNEDNNLFGETKHKLYSKFIKLYSNYKNDLFTPQDAYEIFLVRDLEIITLENIKRNFK